MEQDRILIKQYEQDIDGNGAFKFKGKHEKFVTESGTGQYFTNCSVWNMICHFPCQYSTDNNKYLINALSCVLLLIGPVPLVPQKYFDGVDKSVAYKTESDFKNYLTQLNCSVCNFQ